MASGGLPRWFVAVSSAVSASYSVEESLEERRARERRRLDELADQLRARRDQIAARAETARSLYGLAVDLPEPAASSTAASDIEEYGRLLKHARVRLDRAERELEARVLTARTQALVTRLAGSHPEVGEAAISAETVLARQRALHSAGTPRPRDAGEDGETGESLALVAARVAGRLDARATDDVAKRMERLAIAVGEESNPAVARRTVEVLRREVQQANEQVEQEIARQAELNELRSRLSELPSERTTEIRSAVDAVDRLGGAVTEALRAEAEEAIAAARKDAERVLVLTALQGSLRELGYEVGEEFETLISERGFADARQATWRGYAVRVRSVSHADSFRFTVVRGKGSDPRQRTRDIEVEEEWCSDFRKLREELAAEGIDLDMTQEVPPGSMPVLVAADLPAIAHEQGGTAEPLVERRAEDE